MPRTSIGLSPIETRRFDVERPKDWQPSIRSQEEVDDLWWDRLVNKTQRGVNEFLDSLTGATPREEAAIALDPGNMTPLMMSLGSPLRNPVYRAKMLDLFREQMKLSGQQYAEPLQRLTETHPRLVAAFQHADGNLGIHGPGLGTTGAAEGTYENLLFSDLSRGVPEGVLPNPGFTSFKGTPQIQFKGGPDLELNPATVVPHEFAHFAQDLGGRGVSRRRVDIDAHELADKVEGITDRWKQFREGGGEIDYHGLVSEGGTPKPGTVPLSQEQYQRLNEFMDEGRELRARGGPAELGAERAGIKQRERFERWKRGESDWDKYKGPGHGEHVRHLTPDESVPGAETGNRYIKQRWPDEVRRLSGSRRERDKVRRRQRAVHLESNSSTNFLDSLLRSFGIR
jgi:hypothetical protein